MTLKPYPAYGWCGIEGLESIPSGWGVKPIKAIAAAIAGGTPDTENQGFWTEPESGTAWVAISDMSSTGSVVATNKSVSDTGIAKARLTVGEAGTVLFAMYASVGEVSQLGIRATWNQALLGLTPRKALSTPRFLFYALASAKDRLPYLYRSNTQNNLNAQQVANIRLAIPGIDEQQQIADYLDVHTARIDALIGDERNTLLSVEGVSTRRTITYRNAGRRDPDGTERCCSHSLMLR